MPPPTLQRRRNDEHLDKQDAELATIRLRLKGVEEQQKKQIETAITRQSAVMEELRRTRLDVNPNLSDFRQELDEMHEWIYGNGKEGAKIQIDRLERSVKFIAWIAGAIALTTIGQLVNAVLGTVLK